jgi:hypothetical protein
VKQDPLALAFFGAALALLAGLLVYVFFLKSPEPVPAKGTAEVVDGLRRKITDLAKEGTAKPPATPAQAPKQERARPAAPPTAAVAASTLEPGRSWRYTVVVNPPTWRDITLTYRTQRESGGVGVLTDFVHAGGKSNFHLGVFAAGHPSHANTRFPGFFMYAAYLASPLEVGRPVVISWPWQGGGPGRVKRFEGIVVAWENAPLQSRVLRAAKVEGWLRYLEGGSEKARVREEFWYAPEVAQVIRIRREGASPDEGSRLITAELAEYR